jgi:hypothetical protein
MVKHLKHLKQVVKIDKCPKNNMVYIRISINISLNDQFYEPTYWKEQEFEPNIDKIMKKGRERPKKVDNVPVQILTVKRSIGRPKKVIQEPNPIVKRGRPKKIAKEPKLIVKRGRPKKVAKEPNPIVKRGRPKKFVSESAHKTTLVPETYTSDTKKNGIKKEINRIVMSSISITKNTTVFTIDDKKTNSANMAFKYGADKKNIFIANYAKTYNKPVADIIRKKGYLNVYKGSSYNCVRDNPWIKFNLVYHDGCCLWSDKIIGSNAKEKDTKSTIDLMFSQKMFKNDSKLAITCSLRGHKGLKSKKHSDLMFDDVKRMALRNGYKAERTYDCFYGRRNGVEEYEFSDEPSGSYMMFHLYTITKICL